MQIVSVGTLKDLDVFPPKLPGKNTFSLDTKLSLEKVPSKEECQKDLPGGKTEPTFKPSPVPCAQKVSKLSRRHELSGRGRERRSFSGCSACERQLERRGGLRGKWKPFQCRAWSRLGGWVGGCLRVFIPAAGIWVPCPLVHRLA